MRGKDTYKVKDIIGNKYGKLTVLLRVPAKNFDTRTGRQITRWWVRCDCGSEKEIDGFQLTRSKGSIKSCGCVGKQKLFKTKNTKYYRRLYNLWHKMLYRCKNPHSSDYHKYGARGIKVCERWYDFSHFYDDMIDSYSPGLTIERVNVNGDYEPENCTWIPNADQAKNRRTTVWVDGLCMKDYCKKHNLNYNRFQQLHKNGLSVEEVKIICT